MGAAFEESQFHSDSALAQVLLFVPHENVILVSKDQYFDPHVRAEINRIQSRHRGREVGVLTCGMDEIERRRNEVGAQVSGEDLDTSTMQRKAQDLFAIAVKEKASDVHIRVSNQGRTVILFRVHNDLRQVEEHPAEYGTLLCSTIYQAIADVSDATFSPGSRQDARISSKQHLPAGLDGIRVATMPAVDGYIMVLRLLYDASGASDDLCDLGFSGPQRSNVQYLKKRPTGITIISGPTGSGKSTTLQRTLKSLIKETHGRKHVITVEDPPEYPIPGSVQSPVANADTEERRSEAFQQAIKGAMRVDPDVIMIGEIRDTPSARLAFQAAMTGHQVWSTLHANGAWNTIDRCVDLGIPLATMCDPSILSGLISQRLLKTLCTTCKVRYTDALQSLRALHESFEEDYERHMRTLDLTNVFVTGPGCPKCANMGVVGRTVVAEVVKTDREMLDYVRRGDTHLAAEYWVQALEGVSMVQHAIGKVLEGLVDPFSVEDIVGPLDSIGGARRPVVLRAA